jgi:four helix bundle protein
VADFGKLHVWRKAHALALNVRSAALEMRGSSGVALRNQMIRASFSIPTNIVEGRGQKSDGDFMRFLGYALNSSTELEYHLIVARDTHAITYQQFRSLVDQTIEVRKMLYGLNRHLATKELIK